MPERIPFKKPQRIKWICFQRKTKGKKEDFRRIFKKERLEKNLEKKINAKGFEDWKDKKTEEDLRDRKKRNIKKVRHEKD